MMMVMRLRSLWWWWHWQRWWWAWRSLIQWEQLLRLRFSVSATATANYRIIRSWAVKNSFYPFKVFSNSLNWNDRSFVAPRTTKVSPKSLNLSNLCMIKYFLDNISSKVWQQSQRWCRGYLAQHDPSMPVPDLHIRLCNHPWHCWNLSCRWNTNRDVWFKRIPCAKGLSDWG